MTDRELRKLTRRELLEMFLEQSRELIRVQAELEEAKEALHQRSITMNEAGSIAEAALKLNHVFEAAQEAADQYLESLRSCDAGEPIAPVQTDEFPDSSEDEGLAALEQARQECEAMREQTRQECEAMREQTRQECETMLEQARQECKAMRDKTQKECRHLQYEALRRDILSEN